MSPNTIADQLVEKFNLDRESVDRVIGIIQELLHEGNVRRIVVKNEADTIVMEVPLSLGLVGVALVPVWAAIGAVAALAADFTIEVERTEPKA